MRNMLFRAGLAAGVLLAGQEAPAFAEPRSAMCVEVYDETAKGRSPLLTEQIGRFAVNGIEVHVQILADAESEDILDDADAEDYANRLARLCNWQNGNRVNVLLAYDQGPSSRSSDDTIVVNIQERGRADELISEGRKNRALDELEDIYIDGNGKLIPSMDYQADMAALLEDLDPYSESAGGQSDSETSQPIEWPEVPVKPILLTGLTLAILTAGASRIVHGRRLTRLHSETIAASERAAGQAYTSQENAKPLLTLLPDSDAVSLRERVSQVDQMLIELKDSRHAFERVYQTEKKRWWWPRMRVVRAAAEEAASITSRDAGIAASIHTDIERIEGLKTRIHSELGAYREQIASLETMASGLREQGWQLGHYQAELADLKAVEAEVAQQIVDEFIEAPAQTLADKTIAADRLDEELEDLPARYDEVQTETAELEERNVALDAAQIAAREVLKQLRQIYDPSCYENLAHVEAKMHELIEEIQMLATEAGTLTGQKDVAVIEKAEECLDRITERQLSLQEVIDSVYARSKTLETLARDLPNYLRAGITQADLLIQTCEHRDVSNETKSEARATQQLLDGISNELIGGERPRYLLIKQQLDDIKNQIDDINRRASREKKAAEAARYVPPETSDDDYFGGGRRSGGGSSTTRRMGGGSSGSSATRRFGGGSRSSGSSTTRRFGRR